MLIALRRIVGWWRLVEIAPRIKLLGADSPGNYPYKIRYVRLQKGFPPPVGAQRLREWFCTACKSCKLYLGGLERTVVFFERCHCLTWVPLICTSSLGETVFKKFAGVLESVQQVDGYSPKIYQVLILYRKHPGVQNEGRVSMFKPRGLDPVRVHSFFAICRFFMTFLFLSPRILDFWVWIFLGSFSTWSTDIPNPKLTLKCKPHR